MFGLIITVAILWGGCNALRELALYRSLVANQEAMMHLTQKGARLTELRHYEEIQRIGEQFDIEALKRRKKPELEEGDLDEQVSEGVRGSEVQPVTIQLGLSG